MINKMKTEQFLANHYFCYRTPTYIYIYTNYNDRKIHILFAKYANF